MAGTATLMALKAQTSLKASEEAAVQNRSRDVLVLVQDYLLRNGYVESAAALRGEGGQTLSRFEGADNVDLALVMQEYEEYYEFKFGKKPKLTRRTENAEADDDAKFARSKSSDVARKKIEIDMKRAKEIREKANRSGGVQSGVLQAVENKLGVSGGGVGGGGGGGGGLPAAGSAGGGRAMARTSSEAESSLSGLGGPEGFSVGGSSIDLQVRKQAFNSSNNQESSEPVVNRRLLKPLPSFGGDFELRSLGETIQRDILQTSPNVKFDDVVELHEAKRLLKEAVVMPLKYPMLFTGLLSPWCGVLLYGPPGTGKTMLAKAVASECATTFFNISASSIVSKYRGDSEKLIRVLFELARYHEPATVFMDEIDAIMSHRGGGGDGGGAAGSEHEGSRRMKTELLIQMDGLARGSEHVFVLAASNLPWDLDPALLRRLEKRVLVPLPDVGAREAMLEGHLRTQAVAAGLDLAGAAARTAGYSGADIKLLCKEAAMRPVRRLLAKLDEMEVGAGGGTVDERTVQALVKSNPISQEDLDASIACTNKSSGGAFEKKYELWAKEYGSV